jgi:DNA polymerase-3 subunit gamma/tau
MSYQVLARKLRPAAFEALVGQDHVVRALKHALDHDQLHHAYLFTGTRGVGKTTIARILAKCLNCEKGVSSTPCGECSICREVAENRFVDLIEVDAASRTRVDDTRELLENAQYLPTRGRYKVYLVDEVHMLSASSFNALLKTLEEPPEHVKFLLATTDPKKVPVTVLSRCLQFQLKNISAEKTSAYLAEVLESEGVSFETGALDVISRAARGSMRDALSITDQAIAFGQGALREADVVEMLGVVGRDEVGGVLDALARGDAAGVLAVVAELNERAVDFDALLAEVLAALHRMAVAQAIGEPVEPSADPALDRAAFYTRETVQLFYQIALMGYRDLQIAPEPRSGVEMTLLRMLTFAPEGLEGTVPPVAAPTSKREETPPRAAPAARTKQTPVSAAPDVSVRPMSAPANGAGSPEHAEARGPKPAIATAPVPASPGAPAPVGTDGGDRWHDIVAALDLGGVARMIVEHANLLEMTEQQVRLVLDRAHDTLLGDQQVKSIERALCDLLGRSVRVEINPGDVTTETPAARRERIHQERLAEARQVLSEDATVQSLLSEFDGRLDDVQPLDLPGQHRGV